MDYGLVLYLLLTALVSFLALFVNLQKGREGALAGTTQFHTALSREKLYNRGLIFAVFVLLFAVSACRIAVGNDYWVYRSDFLLIEQNRHTAFEPGFILVVRLLQLILNHDQYLPIFAVFSFFTVLFFVKGIADQSVSFAWSIYLFMTAGFYFSSLNSVRYYLVLSIVLYSQKYVLSGEWGKFILWICGAALFHKSVLVVIPLYFLASRAWKRWHIILLAAGCGALLVFQDLWRKIIFFFYPFYEGSMFDTGETSLTNIAKCGALLLLGILYYKSCIKEDKALSFYFYCNLGALVLYVFASFIPEISRIGFYLNITNIFMVPGILEKIEKKPIRVFWGVAIALSFAAYFVLFLRSCYQTDIRLLPYYNWIFQ